MLDTNLIFPYLLYIIKKRKQVTYYNKLGGNHYGTGRFSPRAV